MRDKHTYTYTLYQYISLFTWVVANVYLDIDDTLYNVFIFTQTHRLRVMVKFRVRVMVKFRVKVRV